MSDEATYEKFLDQAPQRKLLMHPNVQSTDWDKMRWNSPGTPAVTVTKPETPYIYQEVFRPELTVQTDGSKLKAFYAEEAARKAKQAWSAAAQLQADEQMRQSSKQQAEWNPFPEGGETARLMEQHAEILRLREELSMAESTGVPQLHREYEAALKKAREETARYKRLAEHPPTENPYRPTEEVTGLREGLVAAWRILRAVEPEMFDKLTEGETLGDFASRLPRGTERAVVAALHASLKEGV